MVKYVKLTELGKRLLEHEPHINCPNTGFQHYYQVRHRATGPDDEEYLWVNDCPAGYPVECFTEAYI